MKLIDKVTVVAEIEKLLRKDKYSTEYVNGKKYALKKILTFLDTLEVKGVDLEKEIHNAADQYDINNNGNIYWEDILGFARHFYELGLKAQKGG